MTTWYFDKLIDSAFRSPFYTTSSGTVTDYTHLVKNDKERTTLTLPVPGLSSSDIDLEVKEDGILSLRFHKQTDFFKTQHRSWTLGDDVDVDNVSAECKDGVLTVTLPKTKRLPASRKVEIL